jgi:MFS family permease
MPRVPPTRTRYRVVALVVLLGMITYVDRACLSTLAPRIMADFSLSKVQMGLVFSAFALAYAGFGVPMARLLDRHGARTVLTWSVTWWSAFMVGTGAALGFGTLVVTRFLFGMGEAGAWPGMARTFSRWIPPAERGRVQGSFFAGAHLAGGLTPFLMLALAPWLHWRAIFIGLGILGLGWALVWHRWFRDEPAQHRGVNAGELACIAVGREAPVPSRLGWAFWRALLLNRSVIALCVMYFPNSFIFYFCITWLPTYLTEQFGLAARTLSFFAGLPLILSIAADLLGGVTTDWASRRLGLRIGRCGTGAASYCLAGVALLAVPFVHQGMLAGGLIALATATSMLALAPAWATCIDLGQENAAVVSGAMNTAGQVGSLLCPVVVAYALKWYGSWNLSITLMGALFLVGAVAWGAVDPSERLDRPEAGPTVPDVALA